MVQIVSKARNGSLLCTNTIQQYLSLPTDESGGWMCVCEGEGVCVGVCVCACMCVYVYLCGYCHNIIFVPNGANFIYS